MKNLMLLTFTFSFTTLFAQVQFDKQIQLTGSGADAKVIGIQDISGNTDAANKIYVDTAISARTYWSKNGSTIYNNNSGNVGIGLTNPSFPLEIAGAAGTTVFKAGTGQSVYLWNSWPGVGFNSYWNLSNFIYGAGSSNNYASAISGDVVNGGINFGVTSTTGNAGAVATVNDAVKIDKNGYVGIGTITPTTPLQVVKNDPLGGNICAMVTPGLYANGASTGQGYGLISNTTFANQGAWANIGLIQQTANANDITAGVYLSVKGWYQNSGSSVPIALGGGYNSATPTMYINTTDNRVGIGTTSPVVEFQAVGTQMFTRSGKSIYFNPNVTASNVYALITTGAGADVTTMDLRLQAGNDNSGSPAITIKSTSRVGIGSTNPGGQFELSLNEGRKPSSTSWTIPSDARLKNIEGNYTKGLKEILQLKPITYHYKNVGERKFADKVLNTLCVGYSAQDVKKIFPEAIGTDDDGYLNFNMHAILVAYTNAFKEQQEIIKDLKNENNSLKADVEMIKHQLGMDKGIIEKSSAAK